MKRFPLVPPVKPTKENKVVYMVAQHNPETYDGMYDVVELEEWIRGYGEDFYHILGPRRKKVSIDTLYPTEEADIWCNTIKGRMSRLKLT